MARGTGRELTNLRSKTRGRPVRGYTRTCTVKRAILRMLRTGISVRASLRAAVRSKMSGLQSRMRCFDDLLGNAGCLRVPVLLNSGHLTTTEVEAVPDVQPRSRARVGSF